MEEAEVHCRELLRRCEENFTISTLEGYGEWRREWKGRCFQLAILLMVPARETAQIKHQTSMKILKARILPMQDTHPKDHSQTLRALAGGLAWLELEL